jgi:hypothetical protein
MRAFLFIISAFFFLSFVSYGQKPSKEDITQAMKKSWEKEATTSTVKQTVKINEIKMGTSQNSTYAQQLEGVPKGALVTFAKIDWDHNQFYSTGVQVTRRITTAWVFKDQFGDWKVLNVGTVYPGK